MPSFLYLSDVFCPWCYGFAPVMQRLAAAHPAFAVRVLGGDLVPQAESLDRLRQRPNITAFFERLSRDTGQPTSAFVAALQDGRQYVMHSPRCAALLVALRLLAPGHELAQMEFFQQVFYGQGRDVFSQSVLEEAASRWQVDVTALVRLWTAAGTREQAEKDAAEAVVILDEFKVYPTLFLVDDAGERHLVARGFGPYEPAAARLQAALEGMGRDRPQAEGSADSVPAPAGHFCTLDGRCL